MRQSTVDLPLAARTQRAHTLPTNRSMTLSYIDLNNVIKRDFGKVIITPFKIFRHNFIITSFSFFGCLHFESENIVIDVLT